MRRTFLEMKAGILKALGHPTRLAVVEMLGARGERCVCEIAEMVGGGDRTTLSKHLAILKAAGVVADRKDGLWVRYRLNCPCVGRFLTCIEQMVRERIGEESAALKRRYQKERSTVYTRRLPPSLRGALRRSNRGRVRGKDGIASSQGSSQ